MKAWLVVATLCLPGLLAVSAQAQDRPPLLPTRDVAIIYRLPGSATTSPAQKLQATYTDGGKRIRLDFFRFMESKFPFATWIYDGEVDRLIVVRPERREYTEQSSPAGPIPGAFLTADMSFEKQRMIAVAGQPCTNWAIKSANPKVNGSVACVTDEGVVLRLSAPDANAAPELLAQVVSFQSPPDGTFSPPSGFMRVHPQK